MGMIIETSDFDYDTLDREQQGWVYNCLDCCMTDEIHSALLDKNIDHALASYDFVRAMQGPAMHMAFRGCLIDTNKRWELISDLEKRADHVEANLHKIVEAIGLTDFNPNSPDQLKHLLYKILVVKEQTKWNSATKTRTVSVDRSCLEAIIKGGYFYGEPIARHVLTIRDLRKKAGTLRSAIDSDNRMRTSYNVSGTETGRWSSNENCFGTGTNLQNWTDELREIFIADEGKKLAYIDGEQAESRVVAYISGDERYIAACEGGDLHTYVTRMVWPDLDWSDEDEEHNKKVAEQKFYLHHSYRDMAKRLGHGTNYRGSAFVMAKNINVEKKIVEEFQEIYLGRAFKGIAAWHQSVAQQLQTKGYLDTPLGRRRYFLGRLDSDDTLKEAIAYVPQSTIAEWLNLGLYKVWEELDIKEGALDCLMQVHDAVLVQYPDIDKDHQRTILSRACKIMEIPIKTDNGTCIIPTNVEGVGWNWRKYKKGYNENPDSLMGLAQDEELNRKRIRQTDEATDLLTRRL